MAYRFEMNRTPWESLEADPAVDALDEQFSDIPQGLLEPGVDYTDPIVELTDEQVERLGVRGSDPISSLAEVDRILDEAYN